MKRKRIGSRRYQRFLLYIVAALLANAVGLSFAAEKKAKGTPQYAIVAGTVFRENGLSLRGAQVEIEALTSSSVGKFKKEKAVSDSRGEFAFHVPGAEMKYAVSVRAPGYAPQRKEVAVMGYERQDVFFQLEPASK